MESGDAEIWHLARPLFRSETGERFWSSGIHAQHLEQGGDRVVTLEENNIYYDRALNLRSANEAVN